MDGVLKDLPGVRGVLIDVDGTLLADDRAIPGAPQVIERLRAEGVPFRVTTNITRLSRAAIAAMLQECGVRVDARDVINPSILARRRVIESGRHRAALLVARGTRADFEGIEESETSPAWVVLGDLGRGFTRERLSTAFRCLRDGATLLALHRIRYWHDPAEGWVLDVGAYAAALEYAAGVEAEVVGKPSIGFFQLALAELGLPAGEVVVVGDDPETDVIGGRAAGCRTALVRTGKSSADHGVAAGPAPDLTLESVRELIA
jgi:HAD superfamily hydrolase (TIGR01458 family)